MNGLWERLAQHWRGGGTLEREVDDEIAFHLEMREREFMRQGWSPQEARRLARRHFGDISEVRRECLEGYVVQDVRRKGDGVMRNFWQDVKYGARMLARNPGFSIVAVLTLALGIGANTAIFGVVHGILFKPLPYPQPERLVRVFDRSDTQPAFPLAPGNFVDYREQNQVLEGVAIYTRTDLTLAAGERPERLAGMRVSAGFFEILGIQPALGRTFRREDEIQPNHRVAVLSDSVWRNRFASDPGVVGRSVHFSGLPFTVIGVLPPGVQHVGGSYRSMPHGDTVAVWTPFPLGPDPMPRGQHYANGIARLKPGVTPAQAEADLNAIARALEADHQALRGWTLRIVSLHDEIIGGVRPMMLVLLGAVGLVLLMACANVANLQLARSTARGREIAMRAALGASRARLVRQMLTESFLMAGAGGALGLALAVWGTRALVALSPATMPRTHMVSMDVTVFLFALGVTLVTALLFGLVPALRVSQVNLQETLKSGGAAAGSPAAHRRSRGALVAVELAMAFVLLIGAGLLLRSFAELLEQNPGFNPEGVITATLAAAGARYPEPPPLLQVQDRVLERVRAIPGVRYAGIHGGLPWSGYDENTGFGIIGRAPDPSFSLGARFHFASPDSFRALGIPLLAGRFLTPADQPESPLVILVNEAFAKRYFRDIDGSNPVGQKLQLWGPEREIVGVVGDVKDAPADAAARPALYFPTTQMPRWSTSLVVRAEGEPRALMTALQNAVLEVDNELPLAEMATMNDIAGRALAEKRFLLFLVGVFAGAALLLACIGIYGVMAYSVSHRTAEFGIRMALGADRSRILSMVLRQGMSLAGAGLALGLAGALATVHLLKTLLYGVTPTDPLTFAGVAVVLGGVALAACWLPAHRATRVDPIKALRYE